MNGSPIILISMKIIYMKSSVLKKQENHIRKQCKLQIWNSVIVCMLGNAESNQECARKKKGVFVRMEETLIQTNVESGEYREKVILSKNRSWIVSERVKRDIHSRILSESSYAHLLHVNADLQMDHILHPSFLLEIFCRPTRLLSSC